MPLVMQHTLPIKACAALFSAREIDRDAEKQKSHGNDDDAEDNIHALQRPNLLGDSIVPRGVERTPDKEKDEREDENTDEEVHAYRLRICLMRRLICR